MPERAPIETMNLDRYGNAELPWSRPHDLLAAASSGPVLGTTRPDGRPHAAAVGAMRHDGDLYFTSGAGTRKTRNLTENPAATLAFSLAGIDLVLEGDVIRVTDRETLEALAAKYRAEQWPAQVEGDAFTAPFSAPSAGPPPWYLFRFTFHTAFGVATAEPNGATRWRF